MMVQSGEKKDSSKFQLILIPFFAITIYWSRSMKIEQDREAQTKGGGVNP